MARLDSHTSNIINTNVTRKEFNIISCLRLFVWSRAHSIELLAIYTTSCVNKDKIGILLSFYIKEGFFSWNFLDSKVNSTVLEWNKFMIGWVYATKPPFHCNCYIWSIYWLFCRLYIQSKNRISPESHSIIVIFLKKY